MKQMFIGSKQLAIKHAKTLKTASLIRSQEKFQLQICQCCSKKIGKPLNLFCEISEFTHMGKTFPLYFHFISLCGILLLICSIFSIVTTILNSLGDACDLNNIVCRLAITNIINHKNRYYLHAQNYINCALCILVLIFVQLAIIIQKKQSEHLASELKSESNFSVHISNFKKDDKLQNIFLKLKQYKINSIQKIIMLHNLQQIQTTVAQLTFLQKIIIQAFNQIQKYPQKIKAFQYDLQSKYLGYETKKRHLEQLYQDLKLINHSQWSNFPFVGQIILILQKQQQAIRLINQNVAQKCPQPKDIIWQNIGKKGKNADIPILALTILLGIFITVVKQQLKGKNYTSFQFIVVNLSIATLVAIINSTLGLIIRYLTTLEYESFQSVYFAKVGRRLTVVFFTNIVITTFLSNIYFFLHQSKQKKLNLFGLVNDFFFLFVTNSYISSLFSILDIVYLLKLAKRWLNQKSKKYISQRQLNWFYEGHPVDMALRYANILKVLLFTGAISPFVPLGTFFSLLGLMISYWVDKYLLINRYISKRKVSDNTAENMNIIIRFYGIFFASGNLILQMIPIKLDDNYIPDFYSHKEFYFAFMLLILASTSKYLFEKPLNNMYSKLFPSRVSMGDYMAETESIQETDKYDYYVPAVSSQLDLSDQQEQQQLINILKQRVSQR